MKKGKKIALIIIVAILVIILAIVITLIVLMHGYTIDSKYFDITTTKVDNDCITYKFTPKDDKEYLLYISGDDSYHNGFIEYNKENSSVVNTDKSWSISYHSNKNDSTFDTSKKFKHRVKKNSPVEITIYHKDFTDKENYLHMQLHFLESIEDDYNSTHSGSIQPNRLAF